VKDLLNCPNCGAPITAEKCPYCGSVFLDFAAIQVGAPSYVKFKIGGAYICARLVVTTLDIEQKCETVSRTDALGITLREDITGYSVDFHMDAHAVCDPSGGQNLVTIITKE
jgi:hypothetical protein